jgi:DNA-binding XRE family transcriptional regulator
MVARRNRLDGPTRWGDSLVELVRRKWGVNQKTFARLTGFSERAIANWEGGKKPTPPVKKTMNEMDRLYDRLAALMRIETIPEWLVQPNEEFGGLKPLEVIERGEVDRIWELVLLLDSNAPSAKEPPPPSVATDPHPGSRQKVTARSEAARKNHEQ